MIVVDEAAGETVDVICTRCLTPGRGWRWGAKVRCESCHRAVAGDAAVDELVLSDYGRFGEWWTDALLDRVAGYEPVGERA